MQPFLNFLLLPSRGGAFTSPGLELLWEICTSSRIILRMGMMMMTMMMTIMMMFKTTMHPVVGILVSRTLSREKGSAADSRDLITFQFELKKHLDFIVIAIAIFIVIVIMMMLGRVGLVGSLVSGGRGGAKAAK